MSVYTRSNVRPDPGQRLARRSVLGGLAALSASGMTGLAKAAAPALPVPDTGSLAFRIRRNDKDIGSHRLAFRQDGDNLLVDVAVEIVVSFGPIPVFRYVHRASETWRDGVLVAADGKTNDDGKMESMTARLGPDGLVVQGTTGGRYIAPPGAMTANHWNHRELAVPVINPQGGRLLRPIVTAFPEEPVSLASGKKIAARRFNLSGDAKLDLWYDRTETWTATRFVAEDGSIVLYERI